MDFLGIVWPLSEIAATYCRTALRLVHFGGLALGVGGAVYIDLLVRRYRRKGLTQDAFDIVASASQLVALGLALLWISGIGFLLLYQFSEPGKLANPKIYAKMTVVAVLSANGIVVHRVVIPFLRRRIGKPLMAGVSARIRTLLSACAAVSIVSWTLPVVLGAAPQLNFVVPYAAILAVYALLVLIVFAAIAMTLADKSWLQNPDGGEAFSPSLAKTGAD